MIREALEETTVLWSSMGAFLLVYAAAYCAIFSSWKLKPRLKAASCSMSLLHGALATLLSAYAMREGSSWRLGGSNTGLQDKVMDFSLAYFIADLLHCMLFAPQDFLFILHHIATTTYISSCRYFTRHGAASVMALLGLGEMTSPVQNAWALTGLASRYSAFARRTHDYISPFFALYFTMTRGVVAPCLAWKLCQYYLTGQAAAHIPYWLGAYWMIVVVLSIFGSLLWVSKIWIELWHKRMHGGVVKDDYNEPVSFAHYNSHNVSSVG